MTKDSKWKSRLLSSGIPLEYEAAKLLVSQGFAVDADYKYSRVDLGDKKDFSVDLHARGWLPFDSTKKLTSELTLLVECKFRHPNMLWLFLPEPNEPDLSPISLGRTIRIVDELSSFLSSFDVPPNGTVPFDENMEFAFKGIEVDKEKGNAHDSEIRRGILQLQYALPQLLKTLIYWHLGAGANEGHPFFFCPILLTTAPLYLADHGLDVDAVKSATEIRDLAKEVPYLIVYSDYGPDFDAHCASLFGSFRKIESNQQAQ